MKKRRWIWIVPGALVLCFAAAVVTLLSRPLQTWLAQRALRSLSEGFHGSLTTTSMHLYPSGVFEIVGAKLSAHDEPLVQIKQIEGRLHLLSLLHQSLDFDSLVLKGLKADVEIDSSGHLALEDVFTQPAPGKPEEKPGKPWRAHVRRLEVFAQDLRVRQMEKVLFETDSLHIESDFDFDSGELIFHRLSLDDQRIHLEARGSWPLVEGRHGGGAVSIRLAAQGLQPLTEMELPNDTVAVVLDYDVRDSLSLDLAANWPHAGALWLAAEVGWPVERVSGAARGSLFEVHPNHLLKDMAEPAWISGDFEVRGNGPPLERMSCEGRLLLRDSNYGKYGIDRSDLHFAWRNDSLAVNGEIASKSGSAKIAFRSTDLFTALPKYECNLRVHQLRLQDFAEETPEDLPPLDAQMSVGLQGIPPFGRKGEFELALAPTHFRGHAVDTAMVQIEWRGKALTLSKLTASYQGTSLEANGSGILDSTFQAHAELRIRDVRELASKLPIPEEISKTLSGALRLSADGSLKLGLAGISDIKGKAEIEGQSVKGGPCSVENLKLTLDAFQLSPLFAEGSLDARQGTVAGKEIDSLAISFRGQPDSVWATVFASNKQDSVALRVDGLFQQDSRRGFVVSLNALSAEALGHQWKMENPTQVILHGNEVSLGEFGLSSGVGVLQAVGKLTVEGEEDFSLVLLDVRSAALHKFVSLPDAKISAQLHLLGTSESPIVNFEVIAESLQWSQDGWIENLTADGELQGDSLVVSGMALWLGDTLTAFHGVLPMRVSLSKGVDIPRDKAVAAQLRILKQPLTRLQPYMPWGTRVGGWAGAELEVSGTLEQPVWNGNLAVENGSLEDIVHGLYYKEISLTSHWNGDSLFIDRIEGKATGKAQGHGTALMAFPLPKTVSLRMDFDHFQLLSRADLRAKISGDIDLEGPPMGLRTKGNLTLDELQYRITSATTKVVEPVDLEAELAKLRGDTAITFRFPGTVIYEKMDEAVRLKILRNSWIYGGGASIELEGDVWLYKPPNESEQVYGQIQVVRGTVSLYTRKLEVQEGTVTFDGDPQDPNINITAIEANLKRTQNVEITLKLTGTKNHPEIELTGQDPDGELSHEDIISYLTLGRRASAAMELFSSGFSQQETPLLGTAAVTGISAGVSNLVSTALHLEVFEYRPGQTGVAGLTQGELEVGTYVTSNLFVSVTQSMEEKHTGQKVILEYQLLPWLRLRGTRQAEGQSAFDLFFQWEWR